MAVAVGGSRWLDGFLQGSRSKEATTARRPVRLMKEILRCYTVICNPRSPPL